MMMKMIMIKNYNRKASLAEIPTKTAENITV